MARPLVRILFLLVPILPGVVTAADIPGRVWTRIRNPSHFDLEAVGCAVDPQSNVYVATYTRVPFDGQTNSPPDDNLDTALIKWDAEGNWQWTRIWGSTNADDYPYAVAVDGTSFVYVAGTAEGSFDGETNNSSADCFLTKWSPDGTRQWTRIWGSAEYEELYDVAVNVDGDIFVCGYTEGAFDGQTNTGNSDHLLSKYLSNGTRSWSRIWGSTNWDEAYGVAVDADANRSVYVAGYAGGPIFEQAYAGAGDQFLTRWYGDGSHQWTRLWGSTNLDNAYGGVAVDSKGGIFVAGVTSGEFDGQTNPSVGQASCLSHWTPATPTRNWTRLFGPTNNSVAYRVVTDDQGIAYVSGLTSGPFNGQTNGEASDYDLYLTQWGTGGNCFWTRIWGEKGVFDYGGRCGVHDETIAVGFNQGEFDGQSVTSGSTIGASVYRRVYVPRFSGIASRSGRVLSWKGAWDCRFTVAENADLLDGSGWSVLAGMKELPGREDMAVTNDSTAAFRVYRLLAEAIAPPPPLIAMVRIPAGEFAMGHAGIAEPVHTNNLSAFWMDRTEVPKAAWDAVVSWAVTNGYSFENAGAAKATNHPVQSVDWYNVVRWCNARSERDGLTPCYYTNTAQTAVYRTGRLDLSNAWVKWNANGYRLPTEAEWEKAARGGAAGYLFPWAGDTISHTQANYYSTNLYAYDVSATRGYHPTYETNGFPYTAPVGSFATNGYGLYDMAGNVNEWIWDWYDAGYYAVSPTNDPIGPASGSFRCQRGGSWYIQAPYARVANRNMFIGGPGGGDDTLGFRTVRRD